MAYKLLITLALNTALAYCSGQAKSGVGGAHGLEIGNTPKNHSQELAEASWMHPSKQAIQANIVRERLIRSEGIQSCFDLPADAILPNPKNPKMGTSGA